MHWRFLAVAALITAAVTLPPGPLSARTGTAFAVAPGVLVTSAHIVAACREILVRRGGTDDRATVAADDPKTDLALLKIDRATPDVARLRSAPPLRVGERAVTFGFPFYGTLSTQGNLTIGNVSALHGLRDDPDSLQFTAPVQPGSSGSALLDRSGNLIGVVSARLDAASPILGSAPQSVNFAVALPALQRFLAAAGVAIAEAPSAATMAAADIAESARAYSHLVVCADPSRPEPGPSVAERPTTRAAALSPSAERGKQLADRWCATCHLGLTAAPLFTTIARDPTKTPDDLKAWIAAPGTHKMPAFDFPEQDLDDVVSYILSTRDTSRGTAHPTGDGR